MRLQFWLEMIAACAVMAAGAYLVASDGGGAVGPRILCVVLLAIGGREVFTGLKTSGPGARWLHVAAGIFALLSAAWGGRASS